MPQLTLQLLFDQRPDTYELRDFCSERVYNPKDYIVLLFRTLTSSQFS